MPQSITEAHVIQWDTTIRAQVQQNEARLAKHSIDRGSITGEAFTANRLAAQAGLTQEITDRHGDTVFADATHTTRQCAMRDFFEALPVDKSDESKVLADPNGAYMNNLVMQLNRRKDRDFYDAARGNSPSKDGTANNLAGDQLILESGNAGMDKAKIVQARKMFRQNEADSHTGHNLFMVYTADMLEHILSASSSELLSSDYMAIKMLQEGDLSGTWLGFNWIPYENIYDDGTNGYTIAFSDQAVHYGTGYVEGTMGRRKDKRNTMQVDLAASHGFIREQEELVVEIEFDLDQSA